MELAVVRVSREGLPGRGKVPVPGRPEKPDPASPGTGVRVQIVDPERLPGEGLIYKTVFRHATDPQLTTGK